MFFCYLKHFQKVLKWFENDIFIGIFLYKFIL
jgi:hypothetical protein